MISDDYYDYIKSDKWRAVRNYRLKLDGYKCQACGSEMNLNVHHITYERLGHEDIDDVVTLCRSCHGQLHRASDGARKHAEWFTEYLRDAQAMSRGQKTAMFAATVWPKFCVNGGELNLLDMANVLSAERRKFCAMTGLDTSDVPLVGFHEFCNKYVNLLVLDGMFRGKTTLEIAGELGMKYVNILKRKKELMKIGKWTTVDAANVGGGGQLEPGGYVVMVQKVEDHPAEEYLDVTIDIAEGENAFMYAGLPESDDWRHTYRRYYGGKAQAFFKQFLDAIEISNRGKFSVAAWEQRCDERELVGMSLGVIFQKELYTKQRGANAGKDGWRLNWFASIPAQDIRNNEFTVPAEKDSRDKAQGAGGARSTQAQGAGGAGGAGGAYDDVDDLFN